MTNISSESDLEDFGLINSTSSKKFLNTFVSFRITFVTNVPPGFNNFTKILSTLSTRTFDAQAV